MSVDIIENYFAAVSATHHKGNATELTYRSHLETLLESLAPSIDAVNQPKMVECGAPDLLIQSTKKSKLTIGYAETKDIGVPLETIVKTEQLKRYLKSLPNFLLTDYLEFRWYVNGEERLKVSAAQIAPTGKILPDPAQFASLEKLLAGFLDHSPEPVQSANDLATRMAALTHMIRDMVIGAFTGKRATPLLQGWREAFAKTLLPDLSQPGKTPEFADMFAQTLAYGLFSARVMDRTPGFTLDEAKSLIPKTNPFLRAFFYQISGPELADEPFAPFVDDLVHLLENCDMAAILEDFGKQTGRQDPVLHFYETYLAAYDAALRKVRGVYYTPEAVVSYLVDSVDEILKKDFSITNGLADSSKTTFDRLIEDGNIRKKVKEETHKVLILDPACGTGTFLYSVIEHIRAQFEKSNNAGQWSSYVAKSLLPRLFGFELLMASYAVAHFKLGMQLAAKDKPELWQRKWAYDFQGDERVNIFLTNTLDEAETKLADLFGPLKILSDEAHAASKVKTTLPVLVVLGNPPYSGHSANKGGWIGGLVRDYYQVDGKPLGERNPKYLQDDYVKFIRWAQWRIEQTGQGVLAFITNHGYLDNPTFRGMRQHLMQTFDDIHVMDLHGNSKKKEIPPGGGKDQNVFDIQQGVAIGIFIKRAKKKKAGQLATVHHAELWGSREAKYDYLDANCISTTQWAKLKPQAPFYLFTPQNDELRAEYAQFVSLQEACPVHVNGFKTHRDHFAVDFEESTIRQRMEDMRDESLSDAQIAGKYSLTNNRDWQIAEARKKIQEDDNWEEKISPCLYRPFDIRSCYFSTVAMDYPRKPLIEHSLNKENLCIGVGRQGIAVPEATWSLVQLSNHPIDENIFTRGGVDICPLYLYKQSEKSGELGLEGETPRSPNFSDEFIEAICMRTGLEFVRDGSGDLKKTLGPEDIFHYFYAILHSPAYRRRYADFLKADFPRIPLTSDLPLLRELCAHGRKLRGLHLMESPAPGKLPGFPEPGSNEVTRCDFQDTGGTRSRASVDDSSPAGRVWINDTQYFEGVPCAAWEYSIGGYQVCEKWLKDRKGRTLTHEELTHYPRIVATITETLRLMTAIDSSIDSHSGWPLK
ncbi:N-6 DNA methylase [Oscillatoria amoena NRMC-F 0135]|nr:N-6 DNA methylase [Oscillatoria amoena NRMC-F 0135]